MKVLSGLLIGAVILAGCAVTQEDLVVAFGEAHPEATVSESECVVDDLIGEYTIEGLEQELAAEPQSDEFSRSQFRSMIGCGLTDSLVSQITEQMADLDVPEAAAPCVVASLTEEVTDADLDILTSGEITDQYYAKFFDALAECDALP